MTKQTISRREALQLIGVSAAMPVVLNAEPAMAKTKPLVKTDFIYCLNMATIRGHKLGFVKELETASKAGFRAVEIWIDTLQEYLATGKTIKDAKKLLDDLGLTVEDSIGFAEWISNDETTRKKAIEQTKMEMDLLAGIGCKRMAAPGKGMGSKGMDLNIIAERYRKIMDLSNSTGVIPQLEMWGFQKSLSRVSEVLYIAMESGHPSARVLLDIFHLYKGGTPLDTLSLINPNAVEILHMNDYPSTLSSAVITDADRIYPGDGVAPIKRILKILNKREKPLVLSTEVFNKVYYAQDALTVAKTALSKMRSVTEGV